MYQKISKCKLCGKMIYGYVMEEDRKNISLSLINQDSKEIETHYCLEDNLGIIELIGYSKM